MARAPRRTGHRRVRALAAVLTVAIAACATSTGVPGTMHPTGPTRSAGQPSDPSATSPAGGRASGSVILLGRIVTMDEPAIAEAIAFEDGLVTAVGDRDEVLALAGDDTQVIELGSAVAYPGFIDAHAHWIGDRGHYLGGASPREAMAAALERGWTSIAELWVNQERLVELETLAAQDELRLRVDAYLALNHPAPDGTHLGDWYVDREPGPVTDRLRLPGVKITFDNGWGSLVWWERDELRETVTRAHDAGWQVATHTVSTDAHSAVLDAYEAALDGGPNDRHHRIEHAIEVTDEQLARMVALDVATVVHLDGAASDWVLDPDYLGNLGSDTSRLARWRDFVDAGLHVAAASDAPWVFPELVLRDENGRPIDEIAGGADGRGQANPDTPAWVLDQLLTPEQGLRAVTTEAAYALGDEARRGHLAPGTLADLTILDGDVLSATPDAMRELSVVATLVGGIAEWCADPSVCPEPVD